MSDNSIRAKCRVNSNVKTDTFVGISCENGEFVINFPLGFSISEDEKALRKEIILLINTISATTNQLESALKQQARQFSEEGFPFQAYQYILVDYFLRGLYKEQEQQYQVSKRGKIDWGRTIKTQHPYIQGSKAYYLDYVTKRNHPRDNEYITLVHEYCVYDAMRKIGWLYTPSEPVKPRLKLNQKLFQTVILDKLHSTFNDKNRALFQNMLAVINYLQDEDAPITYKCGTNRFEYVWEAIIDNVFGIDKKEKYFPRTTWNLASGKHNNACLEPDTIMVVDGNVYVIDAKYYKYGATHNPWDLPESTSINKQITYGEYIAEKASFKQMHGEHFKTYNAFLMPFDSSSWNMTETLLSVGSATSDWKAGSKEYESVVGILIDVKHLMQISVHGDEDEMKTLAQMIQKHFG